MKCLFIDLGNHYGGAENYLVNLINEWTKENEGILVLKKGSLFEKKASELVKKFKVIGVDYSKKSILKIKELIEKQNVDLINVNGINSGLFIQMTRTNCPIITTVHSNAEMDRIDKPFIIRKAFVLLEKFCLSRSKNIICVSEAIAKLLVDRGTDGKKIYVINNGVVKKEYPVRTKRNKDDSLKICFVGRLEKVKGCSYLINALNDIKNLPIICDIYGEGSLEDELKKEVNDNHLEKIVTFKGFSNNVREVLFLYDAIVIPSLYEASPLTIPEAMNAKTFVVCSNAGGMPFIIQNDLNGFIFQSGNSHELSECLKALYLNPEKQFTVTEYAYSEFENKYTLDAMLKKTFEIFMAS